MINKNCKYFSYAEEYFEGLKSNLERFCDEDIVKYVIILDKYSFKRRRKTDLPHPNSVKNHLERKRGNSTTPRGLARITLRMMDPHYNANTQNNIRKSYVLLVKEAFPKLF